MLDLVFTLLLFIVSSAQAQEEKREKKEKKTPEMKAESEVQKLKSDLDLSEDQITKIKAASVTKFTALRKLQDETRANGGSRDDAEFKAKRKEITKTYRASLKAILTPAQGKKLKSIRKANRSKKEESEG